MTPEENALVAYAILDDVNSDLGNGRPPEFVALDIARAQVYATLAVSVARPTQTAIQEAISGALEAAGAPIGTLDAEAAAEAVGRLL